MSPADLAYRNFGSCVRGSTERSPRQTWRGKTRDMRRLKLNEK